LRRGIRGDRPRAAPNQVPEIQGAGREGSAELTVNPWARSSGLAGANSGSIRGLEALYSNVAGIAFTKKTELVASRATWLKGSEIFINSFGFFLNSFSFYLMNKPKSQSSADVHIVRL
jgi:hypothetical protein